MFNLRSVIPYLQRQPSHYPECFSWKDDIVTIQPKHIYLLNKHCLSCPYYSECIFASENRMRDMKYERQDI